MIYDTKFILLLFIFQSCGYLNLRIKMNYPFNFYTEYHQFYIQDKTSEGRTDSDDFWTKMANSDRLAMEDGIIGIATECYGPVKGELIVLDSVNNQYDPNLYDHVVEGGVELKSGSLQVVGCLDFNNELEIKLKPGKYRIRVYSSNLDSVVGDKGDDFYKIEIWPSNLLERKVLKRYQ